MQCLRETLTIGACGAKREHDADAAVAAAPAILVIIIVGAVVAPAVAAAEVVLRGTKVHHANVDEAKR